MRRAGAQWVLTGRARKRRFFLGCSSSLLFVWKKSLQTKQGNSIPNPISTTHHECSQAVQQLHIAGRLEQHCIHSNAEQVCRAKKGWRALRPKILRLCGLQVVRQRRLLAPTAKPTSCRHAKVCASASHKSAASCGPAASASECAAGATGCVPLACPHAVASPIDCLRRARHQDNRRR